MALKNKIPVPGSHRPKPEGKHTEIKDPAEIIDVSVKLRRNKAIEPAIQAGLRLSHADFETQFGASATDIARVQDFAEANGLTTGSINIAGRIMCLSGTIAQMEKVFHVRLDEYQQAGNIFRGRTGEIFIPESLEGIVTGVFGLDNRPAARPMFQRRRAEEIVGAKASPVQSFTGNQLASIYGFPTGVNGSGETIGIIELGGGYKKADITTYFKGLGIKAPSVKDVLVDKAKNDPTTADSADGEVLLDIEIAGAVAPGASLVVYFAPNTDQGFLDAITGAIHDTVNKPSVISISWGQAELNWTAQSLTNFNDAFQSAATLGITICIAAGDSGSRDGLTDGKVHVDFPASSPYALACGGTTLTVNGQTIISETVWNDSSDSATGGGVSEVFPLPDYQTGTGIPVSASTGFKGRGLPDVAANADPNTGYSVIVDGQTLVFGGTSAVAPLMAGLIALVNQQSGKAAGFINPQLYSTPGLCRDITSGNNITTADNTGYTAGPGWDACSGWGVLNKLPAGAAASPAQITA